MNLERPTFKDILEARKIICRYLPQTPLYTYPQLDQLLDAKVYVKHENHMPTGAFKIRGGINLISHLALEEKKEGVVTASTGNHAQSIAYACALYGVPATIIDKAPSADLWSGQTDEGELGFTYADVDQLLYLLVDQRYSPQDCITAGFSESFVQAVLERIRRSQFKRLMPPIAKLSNRTVGYDFLYLRDWGT